MNRLYFFLLALLTSVTIYAQSPTTWTGAAHDGSWTTAVNWDNGLPTATSTVHFNNGSSFTITNIPNGSIGGLIISGNTQVVFTRNNAGTLTISNANPNADFSIDKDGSSLLITNNITLTLGTDATAKIDGTLEIGNGSSFNTTGTNTSTTVAGTIMNEGVLNSVGKLYFLAGAVYDHARTGGSIPMATWNLLSTCKVTGVTTTAPAGLSQEFGNYQWDCASQTVQLQGMIPSEVRGSLEIGHIGAGTESNLMLQFAAGNTRIDGDLLIEQGTIGVVGATANLSIGGNFVMKGGTLRASGLSNSAVLNIYFSGTGVQHIYKTGGVIDRQNGFTSSAAVNFIVRSNAVVDFGETVLNGTANFILEAGSGMMTAHPQGIAATGAVGSVQVNGTRSFSADADYVYNGVAAQVTGSGLPARVRRLIIDNKSGADLGKGVVLSRETAISTALELKSGYLQTAAATILVINDGATATAADNSFVAGPMQKIGRTAFSFPTGWAGPTGGYIPIDVSELSMSATIQAEYKRATATTVGATINVPLHHVSYCEYWELFAVSGAPTAKIDLHWNIHSSCNPVSYIGDFPHLRVAQYSTSAKGWTDAGNSGGSLSDGVLASNYSVSLNAAMGRYYAMASISSASNSLPVFFDHVLAYEKDGGVEIKWNNLTERDVATYFVERSVNGRDFAVIGQHLPKSNRDDKVSYEELDETPSEGSNYYRIKVIEKSLSKIIFSKVLRVDMGKKNEMVLYPNPVTGRQLTIALAGIKPGMFNLHVFNSVGQDIYRSSMKVSGTSIAEDFELPAGTRPGMYRLVLTGDAFSQSKLFLVQ